MNDLNSFTVRFENTYLAGYEYGLSEGTTRFLIGSSSEIRNHQTSNNGINTLYIPDDGLKIEFDFLTGVDVATLTAIRPEGVTREIPYNKVVNVEGVKFAVKRVGDNWCGEINEAERMPRHEPRSGGGPLRIIIFCVLLLSLFLMGLVLWSQNDEKKEDRIMELLGGNSDKYRVFTGADDNVYILSIDNLSKSWSLQSLIKRGEISSAKVLNENEEVAKLTRKIQNVLPGIRLHGLRFDVPGSPHLVLSKERSNTFVQSDKAMLMNTLRSDVGYIHEITFSYLSDKVVEAYAEEGIKRITPHYLKTVHPGQGITITVSGSRDDIEISSLKDFIRNFNRVWKSDYVNFVIELEDNWLKNKSYLYGHDGFVKISSGHWMFPDK